MLASQIEAVCTVYAQATALQPHDGHTQEAAVHIVSLDEMTGIQALERAAPTLPVRPGRVERREFEYVRHGTQTLIGSFDVVTGRVLPPTIGPTRTEADFAGHVARTLATNPTAEWRLLMDQLNTHQSESLVRLIAAHEGYTGDLSVKASRTRPGSCAPCPHAPPSSLTPPIASGLSTRPNTARG